MQGLLLIDKPESITSFKAVAAIRRLSGEKRVGHTGTLDPMATGVLPIFIGRATALSSYLSDADKKYTAKIKLGIETDTCDITGNIIATSSVNVTDEDINSILKKFEGKSLQQPPIYSAIKKNGIRLYELARKGETVEIPKREIEIYSLKLISALEDSEFIIEAHVSKGTYIRSLARDIGLALGTHATLSTLRRTATSGFDISKCVPLDSLTSDNIKDNILPEETALSAFREVNVTEKQAIRFCNGGQLDIDRLKLTNFSDNELFRVKFNDKFLGLGFIDVKKHQLAIKCVINKI